MNPNSANGNFNPSMGNPAGNQPMPNNYPQNQNPQQPMQNQPPVFAAPQTNNYQQAPMMPQQMPMQPNPQMPQPQPMQMAAPAPTPTTAPTPKKSHALEIVLIIFIFLIGGAAIAGAAYCQSQYSQLSESVNSKRSIEISNKKEETKLADDKAYEKRSANPYREFTGPSDFGSITFEYPKEWSVYLNNDDDSNPTYEAYFGPDYIPPVGQGSIFALSFKLVGQNYDAYIKQFEGKKLSSSSAFSVNGLTGIKVTGKLDEKEDQPDGAEVIIKINNYTAIIRTDDYEEYGNEFDRVIEDLRSGNIKN